ncbi:MAG: nucleoside deaminase [Campylobacteraceae bacterium]|nr:nucleoside deaminase [Campylobacteraceae bacterium]
MFTQTNEITFKLPSWIADYTKNTDYIVDIKDRADFVIEASKQNIVNKTGGPFAAAVFEINSGKLISLGVNLVTSEGLSTLHAEIVALEIAQNKLHTYDLSSNKNIEYELVSSCEPCAMCFGAIPWSGVKRVITCAKDEDARAIGFEEGDKPSDWAVSLEKRDIKVIAEVSRDEAKDVLNFYLENGGEIYNGTKG